MTWYSVWKILKTPHQKILELINEFNKLAEYKINKDKSVAFLYTKNEISEKVKKKFHLKCIKNRIPNNKPDKEVKDLCGEKHKTMIKEIKDCSKKWKDILCSWIQRMNIKWPYYPK